MFIVTTTSSLVMLFMDILLEGNLLSLICSCSSYFVLQYDLFRFNIVTLQALSFLQRRLFLVCLSYICHSNYALKIPQIKFFVKGRVNYRDLCFIVRLRWIFPYFIFPPQIVIFFSTYLLGKITDTKESDINCIILLDKNHC